MSRGAKEDNCCKQKWETVNDTVVFVLFCRIRTTVKADVIVRRLSSLCLSVRGKTLVGSSAER